MHLTQCLAHSRSTVIAMIVPVKYGLFLYFCCKKTNKYNPQSEIKRKISLILIDSFNQDYISLHDQVLDGTAKVFKVFKFSGLALMLIPGMHPILFACLIFSLQNSAKWNLLSRFTPWMDGSHAGFLGRQILRPECRKSLGLIPYGREGEKADWVEGEVEQQRSPDGGLSNPTCQIAASGPGLCK